ncbi:hypothetical protein [Microtetraspora malaysiensis]|uniref:Uncharacterized protein n=1 Tax=Microtetraspora malaysiensis TaxID=161358 RepID=A0ABW6SIQ6_9ACTN
MSGGFQSQSDGKRFARLVARAWSDESIRERYEQNPRELLAEAGIDWPEDVPVPELPARPDRALDLESLETSAGGALSTIGTVSCPAGCFAAPPSQDV